MSLAAAPDGWSSRVDDIEAAFKKVELSAERVIGGDEAARDRSFEEIFALNSEIGRLGRERPKAMTRMKELQAYVNMITVGMKYGRTAELREGLSMTERSIKSLRDDLSSIP